MKHIIGLENAKITAAKDMGEKMNKVLQKQQVKPAKTGLDSYF